MTNMIERFGEKRAFLQFEGDASLLQKAEKKSRIIELFARLSREDGYIAKMNKGKFTLK